MKFLRLSSLVLILTLIFTAGLWAQTVSDREYQSWFGAIAAGGSTVGASANTLGGLGHFSLGLNGTYVRPDLEGDDFNAAGYSAILRLGLLEGAFMGPGLHGIGSVDVYLKAGQMFANALESTDVGHVGGGVRIGILRNSITSPALSVTVGYHKTGNLKVIKTPLDQLNPPDVEVSTWAIRADISKNLFVVTPYAGLGVNTSDVDVSGSGVNWNGDETEGVFYGGVEWNIMLLHLGVEIGKTGGELYGTLGGRFAL
jgi:hypothetical protein